eukprot:Skav203103  [mRNA]  locus=scaffold447:282765:284249:+ [translate_table: standard]
MVGSDPLNTTDTSRGRQEVVLEVGAHLGHCTRVLSRLFRSVLALEHSPMVLKQNARRNGDLKNVVHSIVLDDYGTRVGVHQAVAEVLAEGLATLKRYVGRAPPWSYDGVNEINDWEGPGWRAPEKGR